MSYLWKLVAAGLILAGCARRPAWDERVFTGETQGTTYTVRIVRATFSADAEPVIDAAIQEQFARIDSLMSTYRPDSEISRFNRHADTTPFAVSSELIELMETARAVSEASGGAFDATVAPLVRAWGFGPEGLPQPPPPEELERLRSLVGYRKVEISRESGTLRKTAPDVTIDLNGIAQGYTVDRLAGVFDNTGEANYMIEIGGEVKAKGHNVRGVPWQIGVERPVAGAREIELVLPVSNTAVSTSGDYRTYRESNGVRISHTIDPRSGRPIQHKLASVTIVHPSCTIADGFCTAIMVLGPEGGYQLAVKEKLAAMLLIHDGEAGFSQKTTPEWPR